MTSDVLRSLSGPERMVLRALRGHGALSLEEVSKRAGQKSPDETFSAASWLQRKGFVDVHEHRVPVVRLGKDGERFLKEGLPEVRAYAAAKKSGGASLDALRPTLGDDLNIALAWWKRGGYGSIEKQGTENILRPAASPPRNSLGEFLEHLSQMARPHLTVDRAKAMDGKAYEALVQRPGVLVVTDVVHRELRLTASGMAVAEADQGQEAGVGELTPEIIQSGAWKKGVRPYDVGTEPPRVLAGKPHPIVQLIEQIREIFVELGFHEISGDYVQSAFWNLDALFIPQDHPAREMQDTFYLDRPARLDVPLDLVERVGEVHRSGRGTGSRGWGQSLDPEESSRALLRTHTTATTIRYLADHPTPPIRVFGIGRVFRKETMDATHLPEFHQIEGICTEEGADFPMLLGILKEFYKRLGFSDLRYRPSYYPYTEPSMDIEVWTGKKWLELGGCGIFRPEVTKPFGVETPVLAWGLGLERLAMMRLGLKDIRDLYISDLEWLRGQPLL